MDNLMDKINLDNKLNNLIQSEEKQKQTSGIVNHLSDKREEEESQRTAYVSSAVLLSDKEKQGLSAVFEKIYKKAFIIKNLIDKKIIGGLKIRIGSIVIDNSLLSQLERIKIGLIASN